jgi:hypothetical protein
MKRARKAKSTPWSQTPAGAAAYTAARAEAQRDANTYGFDYGIEACELSRRWRIFMLPRRENRQGFELRCEVVSCENLSKCQPGHGSAR